MDALTRKLVRENKQAARSEKAGRKRALRDRGRAYAKNRSVLIPAVQREARAAVARLKAQGNPGVIVSKERLRWYMPFKSRVSGWRIAAGSDDNSHWGDASGGATKTHYAFLRSNGVVCMLRSHYNDHLEGALVSLKALGR